MKPFASIFRRSACAKGAAYNGVRARYLKTGMTCDMTELLVTLVRILDTPREERHTTPAGRALWIAYQAGCAMVDTNFEAYVQNKAFEEFNRELHRLAALAEGSGERKGCRR